MKINIITGTVLFTLSAILYFLIPSQITMIETRRLSLSPAFYPRLVIIITAALSLIYMVTSYRKAKKIAVLKEAKEGMKKAPILGDNSLRTLTTMAILLGYIYLIEFIGFLLATPIGLGVLMYHMGTRRIGTFCLVMIAVPLVTYFFFERVMLVILPRGVFF